MARIHMEAVVDSTEVDLKDFTVYWLHGERSFLKGKDIADAFTRGGYGAGAVRAVDWYDTGISNTHWYNRTTKQWVRHVLTEQQEELEGWKKKFGSLHIREFYEGQVSMEAVRSTYFKKVEFIDTHQKGFTELTDEEMDFYNNGIHNFGNDKVGQWDHYCDNLN